LGTGHAGEKGSFEGKKIKGVGQTGNLSGISLGRREASEKKGGEELYGKVGWLRDTQTQGVDKKTKLRRQKEGRGQGDREE